MSKFQVTVKNIHPVKLLLLTWLIPLLVAAGPIIGTLIVRTSPYTDITSFMDGQSGRPTLAAWQADNTIDLTSVFQAAAASLPTGGGKIVFPPGRFQKTASVTWPNGTIWEGAGPLRTIVWDNTNGVDGFTAAANSGYITIRDMQFYDGIYNTTRTTGYGINLNGTGGFSGFEIENVYIVGYQDAINATILGYSVASKVRSALPVRDCFSFTGVSGTSLVMNAPICTAPARNAYRLVNIYDVTLNSPIGDNAGDNTYYFESVTGLTVNSSSAENDNTVGPGVGYYLKSVESFTFNSPRASKAGITDSFYIDSGTRNGVINGGLYDSPTQYAFNVNASSPQPRDIIVNAPSIVSPGVGEINDLYGAIKRVYATYTMYGTFKNPYTDFASTGNDNGVETTLGTVTIPAGILDPLSHSSIEKHQPIKVIAYGTFAANGNTKTVNLYWDNTVQIAQITGAPNDKNWRIEAVIGVDTFAVQTISAVTYVNDNTITTGPTYTAGTTNVVSTAPIIRVTGNGTANDVVKKGFAVRID